MSRIDLIDSFARSLSALIRGPAHLREDIADEIADHLATRVEEEIAYGGKSVDPAAVQAEALAAFGDPQKIARELRSIHMGDWIMFQRIMVAALVVIVIGMAATAYFSWSAAQQQSQQFAKMNDQLASLVELQQAANRKTETPAQAHPAKVPEQGTPGVAGGAPGVIGAGAAHPSVRVQFVAGSPDKPVAGYKVKVRPLPARFEYASMTADKNGYIEVYYSCLLKGGMMDAAGNPLKETWWSQVVEVDRNPNLTKNIQIDVSPHKGHEIRIDPSATNWDPKVARRLRIMFDQQEGKLSHGTQISYYERECHIDWQTIDWPQQSSGNRINGLQPGFAKASVQLLANPEDITLADDSQPSRRGRKDNPIIESWENIEVTVPDQPGPISIKLQPNTKQQIAAVFFDGSRDHPLAGLPVRLMKCKDDDPFRKRFEVHAPLAQQTAMPSLANKIQIYEHLLTNERGEFTSLMELHGSSDNFDVILPWHTVDGKPADLIWPLYPSLVKSYDITDHGTLYEFDMSQLFTARLSFTGTETLSGKGLRLVEPIVICQLVNLKPLEQHRGHRRTEIPALAQTVDVLNHKTRDLLLFGSTYKMYLRMILAETKADDPSLELHKWYTREYEFDSPPGQVKEIPIALDELDKWNLRKDKEEWHKRETSPTQTQPVKK